MHLRAKILLSASLLLVSVQEIMADVSPRMFESYNAANGLSDNSAQTLQCTKTGRLVITTAGQINFFDGHSFSYIDPTNENIFPLPDYIGNYHLYFDRYHHLWLKDRGRVTCVNLTTEKFVDSITEEFRKFGVKDGVSDLFVDGGGIVFLVTPKGLVSVESGKVYTKRAKENLQDLETYDDKYLLLFYDNGDIDVCELSTGERVYTGRGYDKQESELFARTSVLCRDGSRVYQIRNGKGGAVLQCFDIGRWTWQEIMRTPYHLSNMQISDSTMYIPCQQGYWTYDLRNGEQHLYDVLHMMNGRKLETALNALIFDKQGGMWVGTEKWGLLYSRPHNVPFQVYSLDDERAKAYEQMMQHLEVSLRFRDKQANCVYRDFRGRTWVGTSSGLHLYSKASEKLPDRVFTRRDGLLNNVVHAVVEDRRHHLWVGTSYGLSCLLFDDKGNFSRIISYNAYDRIPAESFQNGRALCLPDGQVVFQMLDHVLTFYPDKMHTLTDKSHYKIYPKLVKLLVNGNEIRTGEPLNGRVILDKALTRTKEINVDYDMNSLSLTFSALNYFRPQQTYYRVRTVGVDDNWRILTPYNSHGLVDGKGQLHLPLSALRPGSYTVQLQASMTPDEWTTEPYEWTVNVFEPWWRTTGVFLLLGLLLLVLFLVNVWLFVRNHAMALRRSTEEQAIIRRICLAADYGHQHSGELLAPSLEDITTAHSMETGSSREFIDVMMCIADTVRQSRPSQLTMKKLSTQAGMELQPFYQLIASNIYRNPQELHRHMAVRKARQLLQTTSMDMADIAAACGFATPNYFIASFFREYRVLPEEFRRQK